MHYDVDKSVARSEVILRPRLLNKRDEGENNEKETHHNNINNRNYILNERWNNRRVYRRMGKIKR